MDKVSSNSENEPFINFWDKKFLFIFFLIILIYYFLITYGTGILYVNEFLGSAFDSLGKNFLKGKATVDFYAINWETFARNGKSHMYFGPFPAFLRIFLNFLFPSLFGKWSRLSCLAASVVCLFSFVLIVRNQLIKNTFLSIKEKEFFFYVSILSFGLGSPLLFLMSWASIYHEAILWAFAWSILGIYFIILALSSNDKVFIYVFGISFCSGLALLSRVSFALPLYIILTFILIKISIQSFKNKNIKSFLLPLILLVSPALLAILFQLWYNYARFGSIKVFTDYKLYFINLTDSLQMDIYKASGLFNLSRIPYALFNYFGFRFEYFSCKAPFINMIQSFYNPYLHPFVEQNISLVVVSPWIIFGATIGLIMLLKTKNCFLAKLCLLPFTWSAVGILSFLSIGHRYSTEFFPLMIFLYSYYLLDIGKQKNFDLFKNKLFLLSRLLCIISIVTTILSMLSWNMNFNAGAPIAYKNKLISAFHRIDKFLDFNS